MKGSKVLSCTLPLTGNYRLIPQNPAGPGEASTLPSPHSRRGIIAALSLGHRRPMTMVMRRRDRRMRGLSTDRMTNPTGNIQGPRTGRKLNMPPAMKDQPTSRRFSRVAGTV